MMPWPPRVGNEPLDWGDEPVEPPPPPYVGRSVRLAFSAAYDYAGSAIAASVLAFVVYYTAFTVLLGARLQWIVGHHQASVAALTFFVAIAPLLLGPFTAGLYALARAMFLRDDPHIFDIARGAVKYARSAWALAYSQTLIATVLIGDILFLFSRSGTPFRLAAVLLGYILLFWAMMFVYQWPLLVEQGKPLKITFLRSALLAAHNPIYTLAFTVLVLLLLITPLHLFFNYRWGPASLVPVSLAWGILIASLHTSATLEILRKYPDPAEL